MKKTVVISGAGKGIGRACAIQFAQNGYDVAICSRTKEDLISLQSEYPGQIHYYVADVSKKDEVHGFADFVLSKFQNIDVLINNAGTYLPGQVHSEEDGILEKLIETNLYSAYYLTKALVGNMMFHKKGNIFVINSTASITPYVNGGSYCISKYALHGFTKVLREELKPHSISVTSVMPGATLTNSWAGTDLPEDRFIPAKDVATLIYQTSQLSPSTVVEELLIRPILGDLG